MASVTDPLHAKSFTAADGTKYGYIFHAPQAGKPTLLLLHGFCSSVFDWRLVIPRLSATGAGIIAPDLLGYGDTDKPHDASAYRLRRMADHVVALCAAEGATRLVGVGHDWGSLFLSHMWVYRPDVFSSLVFVSVAHLPPGPMDLERSNAASKAALGYETFGYWEFLVSDESPALLERSFDTFQRIGAAKDPEAWTYALAPTGALRHWLEQDKGHELELAEWADEGELKTHRDIILAGGMRGPTNWYRAMIRGVNREDHEAMTDEQRIVTVPTLFVATLGDRICVPAIMKSMTRPVVKDLSTVDIDAGHWVLLEKPDELAAAIKTFAKL